ncbi:MAG TPA: VWA domain-containing protein [Candidatus Synoicihabitans sp.]|nr:VWA domain-containing protein [Candidatus Synoicihabitans sp.]
MSFHWPQVWWALLIPIALMIWELTRRKRASAAAHPKILRAEASPTALTLSNATTRASTSPRVQWRLWLGLVLLVGALSRPQWGRIEEQVFDQAREVLIAVDLSRSMLAPDVPPSRLERAKLLITSLLERLEGERVGLIVFAGTAFLQSPLSADYEILREFLPALGPDFLPQGGTDYQAMLQTALDAFGEGPGADRFLIVLSDGEAQSEEWQKHVTALRDRGVRY